MSTDSVINPHIDGHLYGEVICIACLTDSHENHVPSSEKWGMRCVCPAPACEDAATSPVALAMDSVDRRAD